MSNSINLKILKKNFEVLTVVENAVLQQHSKITLIKLYNNIYTIIKTVKLLVKFKFDYYYMVYSNSFFGAFKALIYLFIVKLFNPRCTNIVHVHRGDLIPFINRSYKNYFIFNLVEKYTNKFILLSKCDLLELANKISPEKLYVLKNCIDKEPSYIKKNNKKKKFIYLSNYILEKGIIDLLEAFSQINENIELECYGDFTDIELKNKIKSFQSENININGPIFGDEKFTKLHQSDCLILPSYNEGMPLVLIEAMSTGTPFISSNVGFIEENVYKNYPLLYNRFSENALTSKIFEFLNFKSFEVKNISEKLLEYYNQEFLTIAHEKELNKIFINES